jgi:replication factor A1
MAAEKIPPEFVLVESLRPGMSNLNLTLKVLEATEVLNKRHPDGSSTTISECVAGDASGTITLTARNKQAALCTPGATVTVRNGKIDMFKGTMRLAVDKWGAIKAAEEGADVGAVKTDYNLSAVEYELVASDE